MLLYPPHVVRAVCSLSLISYNNHHYCHGLLPGMENPETWGVLAFPLFQRFNILPECAASQQAQIEPAKLAAFIMTLL